eukprot:gnl/MRDRNA2_/MRDRNA2_111939_c0_seq1.p1 gnl/MRDRNA2_/MRDRNA2_111939_c0~~gnl/MRDRNA2_/MRDRNA2_111939_c0_seq1.p1  ORF type:complete len:703 (-),score=148.19 gnl/MRDRNA2_/MRDRNA2_111939_c0_seq1:34-2142(-)
MWKSAVNLLFACILQINATKEAPEQLVDSLVDKLFDRTFYRTHGTAHLLGASVDSTTMFKPHHASVPSRGYIQARTAPFSRQMALGRPLALGMTRGNVWARSRMDPEMQQQRHTDVFGSAVREASKAGSSLVSVFGAATAQAATDSKDAFSKDSLSGIMQSGGDLTAGLQKAVEPTMSGLQNFIADPTVGKIGLTFANTVIAWGVPIGAAVAVIGAIQSGSKGKEEMDANAMSPFMFLQKKPAVKEFLKIERLNDRLESYSYSMTKAFRNERQAQLEKQRATFARTYGAEIASKLDEGKLKKLIEADTKFQTKVCKLRVKSEDITRQLRATAARSASQNTSMMEKMMSGGPGSDLKKKQVEIAKEYSMAEFEYIKDVSKELPKETREDFTKLLKTSKIGLQPEESPFLIVEEASSSKPHVFCLQFNGDGAARQVESLRREITAVIRAADVSRNDEVVLRLTSPGGTVTGYGRAAAQLIRIKNAGLKLTICVEEVAASGGYMMACVADHLVASPMAVLGSIGVITELPNAFSRLDKEGIRFLTVTAGEFKRTLTPFKKPTREDELKLKEDLGMVWTEFKSFVKDQRPVLDVEQYGTGETWFGNDALQRNLCDEIANSDDIILDKLDGGAEIYKVTYKDPNTGLAARLGLGAGAKLTGFPAVCNLLGRLLIGESLEQIIEPGRGSNRYMAIDRTAQNTCFLDEQ